MSCLGSIDVRVLGLQLSGLGMGPGLEELEQMCKLQHPKTARGL